MRPTGDRCESAPASMPVSVNFHNKFNAIPPIQILPKNISRITPREREAVSGAFGGLTPVTITFGFWYSRDASDRA
jgi:hypothetical protein